MPAIANLNRRQTRQAGKSITDVDRAHLVPPEQPRRLFRASQTPVITGFQTGAEICYPSLGPVFVTSQKARA